MNVTSWSTHACCPISDLYFFLVLYISRYRTKFLVENKQVGRMEVLVVTFLTLFFASTLCFVLFSLFLYLVRIYQACNCDVCTSYLSGSWRSSFYNLCDWYTQLLRESPTGTIHVHALRNVITSNPENVEYMLKTNFVNYPKGKPFSAILGDFLGHGIFNVDGAEWRFQRKTASMELGGASIRQYAFDVFIAENESRLIPLLSCFALNGQVECEETVSSRLLDLQDLFKRLSFDNICNFSFGFDPGCLDASLPVSLLATAFDVASSISAQRALYASPLLWKIKRFLNMGSEKRLKEATEIVKRSATEIIKQRRKTGISDHKDLLTRFMATTDDDNYLRDIVISFLLAGRDSVASALTGLFWLLSQNPEVVDNIREESSQVLGPGNSTSPTLEQLRKMHYLNATVHESLRLFPPVQFDSKFALEDDVLPDGTIVKAGTRVTYHQYAMGRMEQVWGPNHDEFKPERWLEKGHFVPKNSFQYPVFHAGFRECLGKEIAMVEMKSVALAVVHKFNIRVPDPDFVPRFAPGLTATLRGGLVVEIEART